VFALTLTFKQEVERELTGKENEPWEVIYFKLYQSQMPVIERAIETACLMFGNDLCGLPGGANLDHGDPEMLLYSMTRFFKFLPADISWRPEREGLMSSIIPKPALAAGFCVVQAAAVPRASLHGGKLKHIRRGPTQFGF
jgi:hypothetical protein